MVKNYLPNWIATIELSLRRTLVLQQFYLAYLIGLHDNKQ